MTAVFLKLLNMSITAGWLILAVILLRALLRKVPRYIHCVLWSIVGIRLMCPFSPESILSLVPSAETISSEVMYAARPTIQSGIESVDRVVNPVLSDVFAVPSELTSINPIQVFTAVCANIWVLGMITMFLIAAVSYLRLYRRLRESVVLRENIRQCDHIDTPFIFGIFRPWIYLPSDMAEADMEYVIAHEMAHLKRKDHWWKPLAYALLIIYWFHPLCWVAYILLCRDIELACDEKVIVNMGPEDKKAYSKALLSCSIPRRMISACPLAFGEVGVKERVKSVLNYKKPAFWISVGAAIVCAAAAVCFLTNPVEEEQPFYSEDAPKLPSEVLDTLFDTAEGTTLGLRLADGTVWKNYYMSGDYYAERFQVLLNNYEWTREEVFPEPENAFCLTVSNADGSNSMSFYEMDAGWIVYRDGTEQVYWSAGTLYENMSIASEIRGGYDLLEKAEEQLYFSYKGSASSAASHFAHIILEEHYKNLAPGNDYSLKEYEVEQFLVYEINEEGTAVLASVEYSCIPRDFSGGGIVAGKTVVEDNVRQFVLQKQEDGYWHCIGFGTGGFKLPGWSEPEASMEGAEIYQEFMAELGDKLYYAVVKTNVETPVLLVAEQVFEDEYGGQISVKCDVYCYVNGEIKRIGEMQSYSTACGIAYDENGLYSASQHAVQQFAVDDKQGTLVLIEGVLESFENPDAVTYGKIVGEKPELITQEEYEAAWETYHKAARAYFLSIDSKNE